MKSLGGKTSVLYLVCILHIFTKCASISTINSELLLTPLIEAGNISKAQKLARVNNLLPNDHVSSYSGFITVNKMYNTNLFFWYFPAIVSSILQVAEVRSIAY